MGVFDWTGPDFLLFYAVLFVLAGAGAWVTTFVLRTPADSPSLEAAELDPYAVAYLAGGHQRAVQAALASLAHQGNARATVELRKICQASERNVDGGGDDDFESQVYLALGDGRSSEELYRRLRYKCRALRRQLQDLGLFVSTKRMKVLRAAASAWFFAAVGVGAFKIALGIIRGRPVLFLVLFTVLAGVAAIACLRLPKLRSRRGSEALSRFRRANSPLMATARSNVQSLGSADVALTVALFGISWLAKTSQPELKYLTTAIHNGNPHWGSWGDYGGGCGGGGCGGGGGGGGGCGGCA